MGERGQGRICAKEWSRIRATMAALRLQGSVMVQTVNDQPAGDDDPSFVVQIVRETGRPGGREETLEKHQGREGYAAEGHKQGGKATSAGASVQIRLRPRGGR